MGLSRADVVAWVTATYPSGDPEERVTDGPAAFSVRGEHGRTLLVRRRTGEYWLFTGEITLHRARSDRKLMRELRKVRYDVDEAQGVIHNPELGLTRRRLVEWLDATYGPQVARQIVDKGWGYLAIKGPVVYGGLPATGMFAAVKRTGEVWDLSAGRPTDAALHAGTEAGFRAQLAWATPYTQPIARIPI